MVVKAEHTDLQLVAILGACIAATLFVVGWAILGSAALILEEGELPSIELWGGVLGFFITAFAFGNFIALLTAFPLGWLYGRMILALAPPSTGTASLTGSLTGATLVGIVSALVGDGLPEMWQPLSLFTVLGGVSGAMAFCLTRHHRQREKSS